MTQKVGYVIKLPVFMLIGIEFGAQTCWYQLNLFNSSSHAILFSGNYTTKYIRSISKSMSNVSRYFHVCLICDSVLFPSVVLAWTVRFGSFILMSDGTQETICVCLVICSFYCPCSFDCKFLWIILISISLYSFISKWRCNCLILINWLLFY